MKWYISYLVLFYIIRHVRESVIYYFLTQTRIINSSKHMNVTQKVKYRVSIILFTVTSFKQVCPETVQQR